MRESFGKSWELVMLERMEVPAKKSPPLISCFFLCKEKMKRGNGYFLSRPDFQTDKIQRILNTLKVGSTHKKDRCHGKLHDTKKNREKNVILFFKMLVYAKVRLSKESSQSYMFSIKNVYSKTFACITRICCLSNIKIKIISEAPKQFEFVIQLYTISRKRQYSEGQSGLNAIKACDGPALSTSVFYYNLEH